MELSGFWFLVMIAEPGKTDVDVQQQAQFPFREYYQGFLPKVP
jgi:hypothetical protein